MINISIGHHFGNPDQIIRFDGDNLSIAFNLKHTHAFSPFKGGMIDYADAVKLMSFLAETIMEERKRES